MENYGGEWKEKDREEIDDFYLTGDEIGYKFYKYDLPKFFKIDEDEIEWDFNGFAENWCGIGMQMIMKPK